MPLRLFILLSKNTPVFLIVVKSLVKFAILLWAIFAALSTSLLKIPVAGVWNTPLITLTTPSPATDGIVVWTWLGL